jgi:hypothetical protein
MLWIHSAESTTPLITVLADVAPTEHSGVAACFGKLALTRSMQNKNDIMVQMQMLAVAGFSEF